MEKNLYTFNKDVWFVKLLNWVYGINTTDTFKTFCPIFWTLVFTIIFIVPILFIKMFGKAGTNFMNSMRTYGRRRDDRIRAQFGKKYANPELFTDEESYYLTKSRCWKKYRYELEYKVRDAYEDKYYAYRRWLFEDKQRRRDAQKQNYSQAKESKWFAFVGLLLAGAALCAIFYGFYQLFNIIEWKPVDWDIIGLISLFILGIFACGLVLFGIYKYALIPLFNLLKCIKFPKCYLCTLPIGKWIGFPFLMLFTGIAIVCDMIYATYKKHCPVVTWKDK